MAGDACAKTVKEWDGRGDIPDLLLLLFLVAEIANVAGLPDTYFLFNLGDQPFTGKVYWNPVPQFHWVKCHGHWSGISKAGDRIRGGGNGSQCTPFSRNGRNYATEYAPSEYAS